MFQALTTVFDNISKDLEVCQKYSTARRIINSLLGVDILLIIVPHTPVLDLDFKYRYF